MEYRFDYKFDDAGLDKHDVEGSINAGVGAHVLVVSSSSVPLRWVRWERATSYAFQGMIQWAAGSQMIMVHSPGRRHFLPTIIALRNTGAVRYRDKIPLTNTNLFRRDGYLCMYCGNQFHRAELTRDHIKPLCLGGKTAWMNLVSACRRCNHKKNDAPTPEAAGMKLIATPYEPNSIESLILTNRRILADQLEFLKAQLKSSSKLKDYLVKGCN